MIVYTSGSAAAGVPVSDDGNVHLFHVKGTNAVNTKALEVAVTATSLNSGDCFVFVGYGACVLWRGTGSSDEEKATAEAIANILKVLIFHSAVCVPPLVHAVAVLCVTLCLCAFREASQRSWCTTKARRMAAGGMRWAERVRCPVPACVILVDFPSRDCHAGACAAEYPASLPAAAAPRAPRLFQVSDVSGAIRVEEVHNFSQDDLIDEDVMLLDTYNQVFVWVGSKASDKEKSEAIDIAQKYVQTSVDGRDPDTPVVSVKAGAEPSLFTSNFQGWAVRPVTAYVDPYEAKLAALRAAKADKASAPVLAASECAAVAVCCARVHGCWFPPQSCALWKRLPQRRRRRPSLNQLRSPNLFRPLLQLNPPRLRLRRSRLWCRRPPSPP